MADRPLKIRSNLLTGAPGGAPTNAPPCNDHIRKLGDILSREIVAAGGKPFLYGTPP